MRLRITLCSLVTSSVTIKHMGQVFAQARERVQATQQNQPPQSLFVKIIKIAWQAFFIFMIGRLVYSFAFGSSNTPTPTGPFYNAFHSGDTMVFYDLV